MTRTIFSNARIFDGENLLINPARVAIRDGLIEAVGADIAHEPDDRVIDLAGATLMPGLISAHLHPDNSHFTIEDFYRGERLGKEMPPGVMMAIGVQTCRALLDGGFTGYIGAACAHHIDAQLKMAIAEGIIPGPRIRACSHHIGTTADNNDSRKWWMQPLTPGTDLFADGADALRKLVREEIRCGAEVIKVFASSGHAVPGPRGARNMSRHELAAIVEAAHERGAKVRAHCCTRDLILECIELGVDIIDHGDEVDETCIEQMAKHGTFWVPSLLFTRIALDFGMASPDGETQRSWDNVCRMLPLAQAAGVKILLGDDFGSKGPMEHRAGVHAKELALYVNDVGIDPLTVLCWGTRNGGELLGTATARVGVIAPGACADLIVVRDDPFRDITILQNPDQQLLAVMRDGQFVHDRF